MDKCNWFAWFSCHIHDTYVWQYPLLEWKHNSDAHIHMYLPPFVTITDWFLSTFKLNSLREADTSIYICKSKDSSNGGTNFQLIKQPLQKYTSTHMQINVLY